jgi:hypothetical protein
MYKKNLKNSLLGHDAKGMVYKIEEPIPDSLSFKQLSMTFLEICLRNVWLLKIKSTIGPLSIIGASTLFMKLWWSY